MQIQVLAALDMRGRDCRREGWMNRRFVALLRSKGRQATTAATFATMFDTAADCCTWIANETRRRRRLLVSVVIFITTRTMDDPEDR